MILDPLHLVANLFASQLKSKIYPTIILPKY